MDGNRRHIAEVYSWEKFTSMFQVSVICIVHQPSDLRLSISKQSLKERREMELPVLIQSKCNLYSHPELILMWCVFLEGGKRNQFASKNSSGLSTAAACTLTRKTRTNESSIKGRVSQPWKERCWLLSASRKCASTTILRIWRGVALQCISVRL